MPRGSSQVDWRYDTAALQGRLWTPKLLPAVTLSTWYDFSAIRSLTLDSSSDVSQINDLSGNGNHATQTTSGNRPHEHLAGTVNVSPYAHGHQQGATCAMVMNNSLAYTGANGISIAIAAHFTGVGSTALCGGTTGGLELRSSSGSDIQLLIRGVAGLVTSTNSTSLTGMAVVGSDTKTNSSTVWLNGVSTASGSNPNFTQPLTNIFDAVGEQWVGAIGEFLFFNGSILTPRMRNIVDGYLAWKWLCADKLVASHPFHSRPPLIGD